VHPQRTAADLPTLLRTFVDGAMDAVVVVDGDLNIVYNNAAYVHLTGWRPREFERSKVAGMCHAQFGMESCEDGCVARRAMESGKPTRVDEVRATRKDLRVHIVAIPLTDSDGTVWGAVEQYRDVTAESKMQEQYRRMLEHERAQREALAQELANTTASSKEALDRERLLSQTDGLTGVFNRRYFDARIAERVAIALDGGPMVALILFDLDHFKNVNDTYGHAQGDVTLREFAKVLRASARNEDVVARFGGEEFCMLIGGKSIDAALTVASRVLERIRARVAEATFLTTTSGGISTCPGDGTTPDQLLQLADKALYVAKRTGRNRILTVAEGIAAAADVVPSIPPTDRVAH